MGLNISRKPGESFWILTGQGDVKIEIRRVHNRAVAINCEGPKNIRIMRDEVLQRPFGHGEAENFEKALRSDGCFTGQLSLLEGRDAVENPTRRS